MKNQYTNPKKLSSKNKKEKLKQHKHQPKNESQSKTILFQKITKEKKLREWNIKKHTQHFFFGGGRGGGGGEATHVGNKKLC